MSAPRRSRMRPLDPPAALRRGLGSPALFAIVQGFLAASLYFGARPGGRERARAHVGRLRRRGALLRPAGALLRRGRLAAPGARRRHGARPLRLQRAVELRRGLGDPARLPDPHRARPRSPRRTTRPCSGSELDGGVPRAGAGGGDHRRRRRAATSRGAGSRRYERAAVLVIADLALQLLIVAARPGAALRPRRAHRPARRSAARRRSEDVLFAFTLAIAAFTGSTRRPGWPGEVAIGRRGLQAADRRARARGRGALRRHRARRLGACCRRRATRWVGGADARRRRRLRPGVAARAAALPGRRLRGRAPGRGLQRGDARPVAPRLLAGPQPPDPLAGRAAAPDATTRPSWSSRSARCWRSRSSSPPTSSSWPRIYAFGATLAFMLVHLVGDRAALPRARPRPPVQDALQRPRRARRRCRCRRSLGRAGVGGRLRLRAGPPRRRAHRRARLDGCSASRSTSSTARPRASRSSSASRCRPRRSPRQEVEAEYGSILVPDPRHAARRRHHADGRAARRRGERGRRRGRRGDRGAVGLRGPDGAAARRARARGRAPARAQGARPRQGGGGGVRGRGGRHGHGARPRAPGEAIVREARRRGVEAIVLAAEEPTPPARRRCCIGGRQGLHDTFVGDTTRYVVQQGAVPGDPHRRRPPTASPTRRARRRRAAGRRRRRWAIRSGGSTSGSLESARMFVLVVGAGRVGSSVATSALRAGHDGLRPGRGPALARAPGRRARPLVGGGRRPLHDRHRAGARRAGGGRHRGGRRVHRLHERRQHEPRRRRRSPSAASRSRR